MKKRCNLCTNWWIDHERKGSQYCAACAVKMERATLPRREDGTIKPEKDEREKPSDWNEYDTAPPKPERTLD